MRTLTEIRPAAEELPLLEAEGHRMKKILIWGHPEGTRCRVYKEEDKTQMMAHLKELQLDYDVAIWVGEFENFYRRRDTA